MAIKTTLEQIEEVQAAITKVMAGQSAMMNGRQVTLANLESLTARESLLLARYKTEQGSAIYRNKGVIQRG